MITGLTRFSWLGLSVEFPQPSPRLSSFRWELQHHTQELPYTIQYHHNHEIKCEDSCTASSVIFQSCSAEKLLFIIGEPSSIWLHWSRSNGQVPCCTSDSTLLTAAQATIWLAICRQSFLPLTPFEYTISTRHPSKNS
jgi:hypothetical protein